MDWPLIFIFCWLVSYKQLLRIFGYKSCNNMQGSKKTVEAKKETGRWTPEEHQRFMFAIATHGKDWKKVQQIVGTRSGSQVRSHAQKFFNKLHKEQQQKKSGDPKHKKPEEHQQHDPQQSQNSFLRYVHDDGSNTTPIEIVSLIRGESQKNTLKQVDLKKFQKKLEDRMADIKEENDEEQMLDNIKRQNSYKSMNNILQAYGTVKEPGSNAEMENESFLIGLTRQYKKYFSKGGRFENLIDFGNPAEVEHIQNSFRKRSFTLPQGVEGDEEDLNQRKKRVIAEQATAKFNQAEKESFKHAMEQKVEDDKKQKEAQHKKEKEEKAQHKEDKENQEDKGQNNEKKTESREEKTEKEDKPEQSPKNP